MNNDTSQLNYKLAWTQLLELLTILARADCPPLYPADMLRLISTILTIQLHQDAPPRTDAPRSGPGLARAWNN